MSDRETIAEDKALIEAGGRGLELRTRGEMARFAQDVFDSRLAPSSFKTPAAVMVAVQTGLEVGLTPLAALRAVYVVNGLPAWRGESAVALIQNSAKCLHWDMGYTQGKTDEGTYGWAESLREGWEKRRSSRFSVADAKRAGLWGKGNYNTYPQRMLMWRAAGFGAKDWYADVIGGLAIDYEVRDITPRAARDVPTIDLTDRGLAVESAGPDKLAAALGIQDSPVQGGFVEGEETLIEGPEVDPVTGDVVPTPEEIEAAREADAEPLPFD